MLKPRGLRTMHFSSSLSSLLTLTLNIPPSRFLNQPGPFPIKRDVIPVEPFPQLVPDPQAELRQHRYCEISIWKEGMDFIRLT